MHVEIITIGDELLLGFTLDSNGAHIGRELATAGIPVARRTSVGDVAAEIAAAVGDALDRTGAVITTGGLGPTADDLTKAAIAPLFGRAMRLDEPLLAELARRWKARGWAGEMPVTNHQQAMVPDGATLLPNAHGAAPGIWLEDDRGRWVVMLPGVPREMRGMLADELLPRLRARAAAAAGAAGGTQAIIASRTVRTTGIGESAIADRVGTFATEVAGVPLAYLPGWEGVDLRLTSRDHAPADAARLLDAAAAALRDKVGVHVYGEGTDDLAAVVLDLLRARRFTVAVADCTGGMLGMRLTAIAGSSDVVRGGVIAYANAVKESHLGVRPATLAAHGAVSEETAREMATGVRAQLGADVGVAITGIAGPGGGTPGKPVGTIFVAVDVRGAVRAARPAVVGDRDEIRRRSAQAALDLTRRALLETPPPPST